MLVTFESRFQPSGGQQRIVHHYVAACDRIALARGLRRASQRLRVDMEGSPATLAATAEALQRVVQKAAPTFHRLLVELGRGAHDAVYALGLPTAQDVGPLLALALGRASGRLFQYEEQNAGALLMRIAPKPDSADNTQTTAGDFAFHTDDALVRREMRVEIISLLGVINQAGARTSYAAVGDLQKLVPARLWAVLFERRFSVRAPLSFNLGADLWSAPRAILSYTPEGVEIAWPSYATRTVNPDDVEGLLALEVLERAAKAAAFRVALNPGAYLAFSNTRGVHAREPILFGDREILRTYGRSDLVALRARTDVAGPIFPVTPCLETL